MKIVIIVCIVLSSFTIWAAEISNQIKQKHYFVNHELEREKLKYTLDTHGIASIYGISGIGKTQFLRKYADEIKDHYKIIWFFDCNKDLAMQFSNLAKKINSKNIVPSSENLSSKSSEAKESVIDFLLERQDWLLIFDNLKLNENHKIAEFINFEHNGCIIFSSQDADKLPNTINIKPLDNSDANVMIRNLYPNISEDQLLVIVDIFGGYPVQLEKVTLFLKQNSFLSSEYFMKFKNSQENQFTYYISKLTHYLSKEDHFLLKKIVYLDNNITKRVLDLVFKHSFNIESSLINLLRYDLISKLSHENDNHKFEIHDLIVEEIKKLYSEVEMRKSYVEIVDNIIAGMPLGAINGFLEYLSDDTVLDNIKSVVQNKRFCTLPFFKQVDIGRILINLAMLSSDVNKCRELSEWYVKNIQQITLFMNSGTDYQKAVIAEYQKVIAICDIIFNCRYEYAKSQLLNAKNIADEIAVQYPEVKFAIDTQLMQNYVMVGDIKKVLILADEIKIELFDPLKNTDVALYWYNLGRISAFRGNFIQALKENDKVIEIQSKLPKSDFKLPGLLKRVEYLSKMGEMENARREIQIILKEYNIPDNPSTVAHARAIKEWARVMIKFNTVDTLKKAIIIENYFDNACGIDNKNLVKSNDLHLADIYVIEGRCYMILGDLEKAKEQFMKAEVIYYNTFRNNISFIQEVDNLYLLIMDLAKFLKDKMLYQKYLDRYKVVFGHD